MASDENLSRALDGIVDPGVRAQIEVLLALVHSGKIPRSTFPAMRAVVLSEAGLSDPLHQAPCPLGIDPQRMPTHLALPWAEYWGEEHPRVRLHMMAATSEIAVRWVVAMALAEVAKANGGRISTEVGQSLRDQIERPTLGRWLAILRALDRNLPKVPALVEGIHDIYRSTFEPLFTHEREDGTGGAIETSILVLRNALAHGGGFPRPRASELIAIHRERFEGLLRAVSYVTEGLEVIAIDGERCRLLRGPKPLPVARPEQLPPTATGVFLIGERGCLPLAPIATFGPVQCMGCHGKWEVRDPESSAQIYVRASLTRLDYDALGCTQTHAESADIAGFREMFRLDEPVASDRAPVKGGFAWNDFLIEARVLAEDLVGRKAEIEQAKAWIKGREVRTAGVPRIAWIEGGPGLGKSMLLARLAADAGNAPPERQGVFYHRFRAGDPRCSKRAFLQLLLAALAHWPLLRSEAQVQTQSGEDNELKLIADAIALLRAMERLEAPHPGAPAPRFLVFLDGLDEVILDEPEFPGVIRALSLPGTLFVLAGRPEHGLGAASFGSGCEPLYPQGGLPPMSPDDIRAMLLEGLAGAKYPLLRRDEDVGDGVRNAFVERVVRCGHGLPLYVYLLLEDLRAGEFTVADENRLPDGLVRYYDALVDRMGLSTVKRDLTLLICILARTVEPLDPDSLAVLLANGPANAAAFRERADQALRAGRALLRTAGTPSGTLGYALYHKSFRDYIGSASHLEGVVEDGKRLLALAASWRAELRAAGTSAQSLAGYVARHGVHHLIDVGKIEQALPFAEELLDPEKGDPACGLGSIEESLRAIAVGLSNAAPDAVRRIDPKSLAPILSRVYDFEALHGALEAVFGHHPTAREDILSTVLESRNWTPLYALSFVFARCAEKSDDLHEEARSLSRGSDPAKRELGLYTLKHVYGADPSRADIALLRDTIHRGPIESSVVGQLLIALTLNGQSPDPALIRDAVEGAVWEFSRQLAVDLQAARRFMGVDAGRDMGSVVERAFARLRGLDQLREDLEASPHIGREPILQELVESFFGLPERLEVLRRAQAALARSPELVRITRLLFGSPFWEVGEAAASVIAPLMSERSELGPLIRELLVHEDWHVRYSAFNAAYFSRPVDGGRLLEEALQSRHLDESAWVRGLWPGMLKSILVTHPERLLEMVRRFTPQIATLLIDGDAWPLMEIGLLIGYLQQMGFDTQDLVSGGVSPLLGDPLEWSSYDRYGLFDRLERRRRAARP